MVRLVLLGKPNSVGKSPYVNVNPSGGASIFMSNTSPLETELLQLLPERRNLTLYHPEWIKANITYDLIQDCNVNMTFLYEGAGYLNSFGYFIYDTANPPTSPYDLGDLMIVFPDASFNNNALASGDTVALPSSWTTQKDPTNTYWYATPNSYDFTSGQSIGLMFVSNGWNGTCVSSGGEKFFSISAWNPETVTSLQPHFVSIQSSVNPNIIYASVEDMDRQNPSCDNDFNDVVVTLISTPTTAIPYTAAIRPITLNSPPTNYTYGYKKVYSNNSDGTISECLATLRIPSTAEIRSEIFEWCAPQKRTNQCYVESIVKIARVQQRNNMPSVEPFPGLAVSSAHPWANETFTYNAQNWSYQNYGDDTQPSQQFYGIHFFSDSSDAINWCPPM